jgi:hypothetical protein
MQARFSSARGAALEFERRTVKVYAVAAARLQANSAGAGVLPFGVRLSFGKSVSTPVDISFHSRVNKAAAASVLTTRAPCGLLSKAGAGGADDIREPRFYVRD